MRLDHDDDDNAKLLIPPFSENYSALINYVLRVVCTPTITTEKNGFRSFELYANQSSQTVPAELQKLRRDSAINI